MHLLNLLDQLGSRSLLKLEIGFLKLVSQVIIGILEVLVFLVKVAVIRQKLFDLSLVLFVVLKELAKLLENRLKRRNVLKTINTRILEAINDLADNLCFLLVECLELRQIQLQLLQVCNGELLIRKDSR